MKLDELIVTNPAELSWLGMARYAFWLAAWYVRLLIENAFLAAVGFLLRFQVRLLTGAWPRAR